MLLVATLFSVHDLNAEDLLIRSLCRGGSWQIAARHVAPELVGTDLLRHQQDVAPALYLCLDFWTKTEAHLRSCRSPAVQSLFAARRMCADSAFELGAFAFATIPEVGNSLRAFVN